MNKKLIPLILASSTLLFACNEDKANENSTASSVSKEDAVAVVNGTYISKTSLTTLEAEIAQRSRGQSFPKEQLIEELIQRELLVQDAVQKQLDKSAEFTERLETIKKSLLSQVAIQNYLKS
ncbi:MAG: peptidylprolyl isomerase, partial [Methylococcales bacterium]|nr:peptidylprolyl isomerase [Methylococcales bacterium]